jgi:hypothetical protein
VSRDGPRISRAEDSSEWLPIFNFQTSRTKLSCDWLEHFGALTSLCACLVLATQENLASAPRPSSTRSDEGLESKRGTDVTHYIGKYNLTANQRKQ